MTQIIINTDKKRHRISPLLYGIFFEDINYGGDGGLYGELIANRSFEYYDRDGQCDKHKMCWYTVGDCNFEIKTEKPLNEIHTHYARVSGKALSGLGNTGYCGEGFYVFKGGVFDFSFYARTQEPLKLKLQIRGEKQVCGEMELPSESFDYLQPDGEGQVYGEIELTVEGYGWTKYEGQITARSECENARLELLLGNDGTVDLEFISLFPRDTFHNRSNGLRRDLCELLQGLSPKFMRFPGGCIVEGRSLENMYRWKDTIGSVEERRTNWNRWQMEEYQQEGRSSADYFQSYGLGFYEYFLLCEDLGAKPLPVINAGMTCQWHEGLLVELAKLDPWIQDVLDLIEFANGEIDTPWGQKRAQMGHPEPFGLEYIGIGNEQWGMEYFERYEAFEKVLSKEHPEIKLVTSAGWDAAGKEFDTAMDWMRQNKEKAYAVDEHFYKSPEWFLENIDRYDSYDRSLPKVFLGEYAAHTDPDVPKRRNNMRAALAEAAFLTGVERNADHVVMSCYAPLFGRLGCQQWQPNLIWFDGKNAYTTPNYQVQKLFSEHVGDYDAEVLGSEEDVKISASVSQDESILFVKLVNLSKLDKMIKLVLNRQAKACTMLQLTEETEPEGNCSDGRAVGLEGRSLDGKDLELESRSFDGKKLELESGSPDSRKSELKKHILGACRLEQGAARLDEPLKLAAESVTALEVQL